MAFDMRGSGEAPRRPYNSRNDEEVFLIKLFESRIEKVGGAVAASTRLAGINRKKFGLVYERDAETRRGLIVYVLDVVERAIASGDLGSPHTLGEWRSLVSTLEVGRRAIRVTKKTTQQ